MCGSRNYDGEPLDERGRTTAEALAEDGTDAVCERLDRLIELVEQQGEQSRQETMRRMQQAGVQEAVGAQNDLLTGLVDARKTEEIKASSAKQAIIDCPHEQCPHELPAMHARYQEIIEEHAPPDNLLDDASCSLPGIRTRTPDGNPFERPERLQPHALRREAERIEADRFNAPRPLDAKSTSHPFARRVPGAGGPRDGEVSEAARKALEQEEEEEEEHAPSSSSPSTTAAEAMAEAEDREREEVWLLNRLLALARTSLSKGEGSRRNLRRASFAETALHCTDGCRRLASAPVLSFTLLSADDHHYLCRPCYDQVLSLAKTLDHCRMATTTTTTTTEPEPEPEPEEEEEEEEEEAPPSPDVHPPACRIYPTADIHDNMLEIGLAAAAYDALDALGTSTNAGGPGICTDGCGGASTRKNLIRVCKIGPYTYRLCRLCRRIAESVTRMEKYTTERPRSSPEEAEQKKNQEKKKKKEAPAP